MTRQIRPAQKTECRLLAALTAMASGGLVAALLQNLIADITPEEMLSVLFQTDNPTYSWRNAMVAESEGRAVGMVLMYPARNAIDHVGNAPISPEGRVLMQPFVELIRPESFYLCALAVLAPYRGRGFGRELLQEAVRTARRQGFPALTLHVFEQNRRAVALYRNAGFVTAASRPCPGHPRLLYPGEILLLEKALSHGTKNDG